MTPHRTITLLIACLFLAVLPSCNTQVRETSTASDSVAYLPEEFEEENTSVATDSSISPEPPMTVPRDTNILHKPKVAGKLNALLPDAGDIKQWQDSAKQIVPRKLNYSYERKSVYEGETIDLKVVLWDNENKLVRGKKDYPINVTISSLDKKSVATVKTYIKEGDGTGVFKFTPDEPGIYRIVCANPEMLPAEWIVKVLPKGKKMNLRRKNVIEPARFVFAASPQNTAKILVITPEEKSILADGKDFAVITFILDDPENVIDNSDSVRLIVNNSNGILTRHIVYVNEDIPETVWLTSRQTGRVTVTTSSSLPVDKPSVSIKFMAPIDHFELRLSPPEINLFDFCKVVIDLKNKEDVTIASDRLIPSTFDILAGSGKFEKDTLRIRPGETGCKINFQPTGAGLVTIRAQLPDLPHQSREVTVTWPFLLITCAVIFGVAGGYIANKRKKTNTLTILTGGLVGLAFYWFVLFFFYALLPLAVILNPVSAIVLGLAGGFAGTEVLRVILQRFGIGGNAPA